MKYDIFISYKRKPSSATASYLYHILQQRGYNVFFDRKEMRSGKFNEQILEHIGNATDILILLEEESLCSWFDSRTLKKSRSTENSGSADTKEVNVGSQEEPYKSDWFCKEVMFALSLTGKNIIPVLLNGYRMPEKQDLPPEMQLLPDLHALELDVSEMEENFEKIFIEQGNLHSKPTKLSFNQRFQGKGGVVGCFLFYTEAASCDLYECGEQIATLTEDFDEWHPFRYPVSFAGEHRFKAINNDSCEVVTIRCAVDTYSQQYVQVKFNETRDLWKLTPEEINAQNDMELLFNWGVGLFEGTSQHEPDITLSFECLNRAIDLGSQEALSFISSNGVGLITQKRAPAEVAFQWYSIAAEQGNKEAQCNLGRLFFEGNGVEQDFVKAIEWHTKAAEQGNVYSQNELGNIYFNGHGAEQDFIKAFYWYTKSAEQGNAIGQSNLGNCYHNGFGVEQDYEKAIDLYLKAAEQGDAYSLTRLGGLYLDGEGVEQDYGKAFQWYMKAAEQGDAVGQSNLGNIYHHGLGVEQDYGKAIEWYMKAAEQDDAYAENRLGGLYFEGLGVERDCAKAFYWWNLSAKQGDPIGQSNVGNCYQNGFGVEQDFGKAMEWFMKSAEQGDAYSLCKIGNLFYSGQGVEQDYMKAVEWYMKAAEQEYEGVYNELAWTYHMMGDNDNSLLWAEKAIEATPENPNVIDTLATVYEDLGRYEEALEQFEKCLEMFKEQGVEDGIKETAEKITALKKKMKSRK